MQYKFSLGTNYELQEDSNFIESEIDTVIKLFRDGFAYPPPYLEPKISNSLYRGALILTVTVSATDSKSLREPKQLFRIDISVPMPHNSDTRSTMKKLNPELRDEIFCSKTKPIVEHFNRHYSAVKSKLSHSYLLFPAVPACSIITFTLSEVTVYPKVVILAQNTLDIYNSVRT